MNDRLKQCFLLMLSDISDSDSSESSDDSEPGKLILHLATDCLLTEKIKLIKNCAEVRIEAFTDEQFLKNLGVGKKLALFLSKKFELSSHYLNIIDHGKVSLSATNHIYVFLWFISHLNMTYRAISRLFSISLSTVHFTLQRVGMFLSELAPQVIKWPNEDERQMSSDCYLQATGISGIIGSVGSTFMMTDKVKKDIEKNLHIVPVQAVCNHEDRFIDVFIGKSIITIDSLFEQSCLEEKLETLSGDQHVVGSSEYPCSQNLIVPISAELNLDHSQLDYNSKLHICLEQNQICLQNLKDKFKQLKCMRVRNPKLQYLIIKSTFVLYNLSYESGDNTNDHDYSNNCNLLKNLINTDKECYV